MRLYRHSHLQGLEVWQGIARHSTLHQLRYDKGAYFSGLDEFLGRLHAGTAQTAAGDPLGAAAGFQRLLLAGGDAADAAATLQWPNELAGPGPFARRAGAEAIWRENRWRNPSAIDRGQTRLKIITPNTNQAIERDEAFLPFGRTALPEEEGRVRLRQWLCAHLPASYDGVLLALPNAIDPEGRAESSTYPGLYGPVEPIFNGVFGDTPVIVGNDAILTARGYPPAHGEKTLLLTLGFGVGAALWF